MKRTKAIIIIILLVITDTVYLQGQNYDALHKMVVAELQEKIPLLCNENNIPGFTIAVVDKNDTIWSGTYGYTSKTNDQPVNKNTLFALMSCSKSITALGVLMAVQDGLLDLDEPISTYIPGYVINSRFDDNPENKITLRYLLSHKAGFENDAYCEEFNNRPHEIEEYIGVVSKSWLSFSVAYRDYYSNIGFEVAAYILEKKTKMTFRDYMKKKVFNILGMENSTYDLKHIEPIKNRALGNWASKDEQNKQPSFLCHCLHPEAAIPIF